MLPGTDASPAGPDSAVSRRLSVVVLGGERVEPLADQPSQFARNGLSEAESGEWGIAREPGEPRSRQKPDRGGSRRERRHFSVAEAEKRGGAHLKGGLNDPHDGVGALALELHAPLLEEHEPIALGTFAKNALSVGQFPLFEQIHHDLPFVLAELSK